MAMNKFGVGAGAFSLRGGPIQVLRLGLTLQRGDALNLASWLIAICQATEQEQGQTRAEIDKLVEEALNS